MRSRTKSEAGSRIVLIDDNPFDAELIELTLQASMACHVIVVDSRQAFLSELSHAAPDVIISDSNLPSFDGMTALALALEQCPAVPFVFCSGAASDELKTKALALGAKVWLHKDELERLAQVVCRLCGEPPPGMNK